jgi:uncharacterized membrane protein
MLNVVPLGLLGAALAFDLIDAATGTGAFIVVAYWLIAAGIVVGGLFAVPFAFVDWLRVPRGTRARRMAGVYAAGGVAVVVLFAAAWLMREPENGVSVLALAIESVGLALSLVATWLGAVSARDRTLDALGSLWDDSDTRPQRGGAAKAH